MIDRIRLTYVNSEDISTCYLSREQLQKFGLENEDEYFTLSIGLKSIKLRKSVSCTNDTSLDKLYLSKDIEKQLSVEQGTILQIKKADDAGLELGPYIGIFINQEKIDNLKEGVQITEYMQFNAACKGLYGMCCFFSIENINWDEYLIEGMILTTKGWSSKVCPVPKVIYDRNVENNSRSESIELRKRLSSRCSILNSIPKLAKLETINLLKQNEKLTGIIPDTIRCSSAQDVESVLEIYSNVYLKPDALSKGKGIYKIVKKTDGQFRVEYRTQEANHVATLKNIKDLRILLDKYSEKGGGYIIQNEIDKALFRGNSFDLRLLFQKDYSGIWKLSGTAARIAAKGSIITSPRSGGTVEDFAIVLKETFHENLSKQDGIYAKLLYYGREICRSIEKEFGDCVELGLDMAVDSKRGIWVVEVNGKPLKVSLIRLNNPEIMDRCSRRPIEYSARTAGFDSWDTHNTATKYMCWNY